MGFSIEGLNTGHCAKAFEAQLAFDDRERFVL